ncbi:DNA replication and repair protein RecF [Bacteroides uniformis]|nr:DNA replication and repair protein RecF [Bacteroides uniformis]
MYCFRFCIIFVTELIVTIMILKRISILNYKNLEQVELSFSPKLNCFFGQNGMGKTNLLDAVYFLSFCKSAGNPIDSQNICHDADFFVIQGFYEAADGTPEEIYCGMKRRQKKQFKRNKKEYTRLSDHIGFLPLVMVSPADSELIAGGSDERRRFMDVVISQYDKEYLDALIRYNKALVQRNTLLKSEQPVEEELFLVWEEMMAQAGEVVFRKREAFIREFIPIFQSFYSFISQDREKVGLSYDSHARDASLLEVLKESRARDQIMGYSLRGVHKDELNMLLGDFPIKREGSQGQNKTYLVALKLAQFDFLKRTGTTVPLLLLDDIFDKLDASRVEQIIKLVAGNSFGQIFITDTNREHLDRILHKVGSDYKMFRVEQGTVAEMKEEEA